MKIEIIFVKYSKGILQIKIFKKIIEFSRCEKCDIRLCRNCDNTSTLLNWYEKDGIDKPDVYWCDKCIKKHKKSVKQVSNKEGGNTISLL